MQTKTCLFCCILNADKKKYSSDVVANISRVAFATRLTLFVKLIGSNLISYNGTEQKINRCFARIETIELPYKIRKQVMLRRMLYNNDAPRHFMS